MMHQRYGRIICVSSVVGLHGNAGQANYAASKAGLIGLTKSAAKEYAARNITANVVAPGFIATDMTAVLSEPARAAAEAAIPAGKIGHAEDVAAAVAFWQGSRPGILPGRSFALTAEMGNVRCAMDTKKETQGRYYRPWYGKSYRQYGGRKLGEH